MSRQIVVGKDSPLSRFHAFNNLRIGRWNATSVEQGRWAVSLLQSGHDDLADRLINDKHLRRFPTNCSSWVETNVRYPSGAWVVHAKDVYLDILIDQMSQKHSEFRAAYTSAVKGFNGETPTFVVTSSTHELVWSSGVRESQFGKVEVPPGLNIYGKVLRNVYRSVRGEIGPLWGIGAITRVNPHNLTPGFTFPRAVLVLSDSTCRNIKHIQCGRLVRKSGGVFSDIIECTRSLRLGDFGIVIVNGGVNVAQRPSDLVQRVECLMIVDFLRKLVTGNNPPYVLFSGALPLPGASGVAKVNNFLETQLRDIPVNFVNWTKNGQNPFMVNGNFGEHFLRSDTGDGFHLGPKGIRLVWETWCKRVPLLKCVSYSLSTTPYKHSTRPGERDITQVRKRNKGSGLGLVPGECQDILDDVILEANL